MASFEAYLLGRGYIKHVLKCGTMKYELAGSHTLSSLNNLDYRYIHKDDKILNKIAKGLSLMDGITLKDREKVIIFGLREYNKPPTLIYPRPRIEVTKMIDGENRTVDNSYDDSMNLVLLKEEPDKIFEALYNREIVFEYDLTKKASAID